MRDYTNELIDELINAGIASQDSIEPCTLEEIAEIEKFYSISLPEAYKQFLLKMGCKAGTLLQGTHFYYPFLKKVRGYAESLLNRWDDPFTLSKTDFVFLDHQGKQFMYFDTTAGDDPPIKYYKEAGYKPEQVNDSFSDWLKSRVKEAIYIQEQINALKSS